MSAVPATEGSEHLFGITKRMISFGRGSFPNYENETQVEVHWQSSAEKNGEFTILDDTRKIFGENKPMTLILGRSFRLPCLETMVKTMCVGEVAEFTVTEPSLTTPYVAFATSLRSLSTKHPTRGHCCAGLAHTAGWGHPDLDVLASDPSKPLRFIIELRSVSAPGEYNRQKWQMSDSERADNLETKRLEGNKLVAAGDWVGAAALYSEALESIDLLCSRDLPGEPEWKEYDDRRIVFYLNLAHCQLQLEDFVGAIDSCSEVLRRDSKNTKALFRRARAYSKVWESDKAFADWATLLKLDPSLMQAVMRESNEFKQKLDAHEKIEAENLKAAFQPKH